MFIVLTQDKEPSLIRVFFKKIINIPSSVLQWPQPHASYPCCDNILPTEHCRGRREIINGVGCNSDVIHDLILSFNVVATN